MTSAQRASLSAVQLETGLPPMKVQIELSFPQSSPTEGQSGSRYSVLVSEGPLQDIAISHLISMLKKLMFSFGSESLRSALEAIERLGSLQALAQAGPLKVPRPGGCEFTDYRAEAKPSSTPKLMANMANDWARFAWGRRRSESNRVASADNAEAEAGMSVQSLPLGIFSKAESASKDRSRSRSSTRSAPGAEGDADNFVKDLPLTLAPAARSSVGSTTLILPPTIDPRIRSRKEKADDDDDAYTLPSIAELPETEDAAPCSEHTFAASQAATLGNPRSRCESSRSVNDIGRDYLSFQDMSEESEPPNAPYLPGEVWPTPTGWRSPSEIPSPVSDSEWLFRLRGEASKDHGA